MIPLYLQLGIAVLGWLFSTWLLIDTWRVMRALRWSGRNGARWRLVTGDLLDEGIRVLLHLMVLVPTVLRFMLYPDRPFVLRWGYYYFMALTMLLMASSLNRVVTRRSVTAALHRWR